MHGSCITTYSNYCHQFQLLLWEETGIREENSWLFAKRGLYCFHMRTGVATRSILIWHCIHSEDASEIELGYMLKSYWEDLTVHHTCESDLVGERGVALTHIPIYMYYIMYQYNVLHNIEYRCCLTRELSQGLPQETEFSARTLQLCYLHILHATISRTSGQPLKILV